MAIKKYKPTSPGRRFATYLQHEAVTKSEPEKSLTEGLTQVRRAQRPRTRDLAPPRRRRQAPATARSTSSAARTACRPRSPRSSTTRTARRTSRCSTTRTARSATSSRRRGSRSATRSRPARARTSRRATALPLAQHPDRHDRAQRRADARARRPARPLAPAPRSSWSRRRARYATLRLPSGEMRMVLVDCRATIGVLGNAEHELVELGKAGRSRHRGKRPQTRGVGDEPGRPPARRRRGAPHAGRPPGHALGRADARLPHAQEAQGVRQLHRARPPARQEGSEIAVSRSSKKGPFVAGAPAQRASRR